MGEDDVVEASGLWKRYGLPLAWARESSFRANPAGSVSGAGRGDWALADVSFSLKRGETLGIIGRNGAGKSTLLKVLSGVTPPTRGRVDVRGRVFPMLELNAGVHPELTGRENAELLAAVVGLGRSEARACMPDIEAFCELGEWFDRPVRKYSSGMLARLGFSVAMHVNAEILLIDEVLAVGDFAFQKKCVSILADRTRRDTAAILVSHNPYLVERMCDRVLLMNDGRPEELGEPADVIPRYFQMGLADLDRGAHPLELSTDRPGTGEIRVERLELIDAEGASVDELRTDEPGTFRIHFRAEHPVQAPNFGLRLYDAQNTIVLSFNATGEFAGREVDGVGFVDCRVARLPLMPNVYLAQIKIAGDVTYDVCEVAGRFVVRAGDRQLVASGNMGIAYADSQWELR